MNKNSVIWYISEFLFIHTSTYPDVIGFLCASLILHSVPYIHRNRRKWLYRQVCSIYSIQFDSGDTARPIFIVADKESVDIYLNISVSILLFGEVIRVLPSSNAVIDQSAGVYRKEEVNPDEKNQLQEGYVHLGSGQSSIAVGKEAPLPQRFVAILKRN